MNSTKTLPEVSSQSQLKLGDVLGILSLVAVLLLLSILRSRHAMFTADEVMTLYVLRQPTFHASVLAWKYGIDSGGIWFYVFGRQWIKLFGATEVSLHLYSAAGMACAAALVWATARRYYSILPVAAAVSFVFASSQVLRWQLAYGRTYGVFAVASALVLFLVLRGEQAIRRSYILVAANMAAYALLAGSHILGSCYAAAFLSLQIILDLRERRLRPLLYLGSAAASMSVFLFSLPNLRATAALGKPTFWTVRPTIKDLVIMTNLLDHRVTAGLVLVLLLVFIYLRPYRSRAAVYVTVAVFAALNLAFFALSHVTTSIYVDRYLIPFHWIAILVLCELFTQLAEANAPMPAFRRAVPALYILLAAAGFTVPRLQRPWYPIPNYTQGFVNTLPHGVPVIDADAASFVELQNYQAGALPSTFLYPVDWEVTLDPANHEGVSATRELENLKAEGFHSTAILPTDEVLSHDHDFAVVTDEVAPLSTIWLQRRILSDPHYVVTSSGSYPIGLNMVLDTWLVHPVR